MSFTLIRDAQRFAQAAHHGQKRKYTGDPYYAHLAAVASTVDVVAGAPSHVIAAAYLHDVIEDTPITYVDVRDSFGIFVAELVMELTDVSKLSDGNRAFRKKLDREHLGKASYYGKTIKYADILDNTKDIYQNDIGFAAVYLPEAGQLLTHIRGGHESLWFEASRQVEDLSKLLLLNPPASLSA